MKVFKHGRKRPWVPTLTGPFPAVKRMLAPDWEQKCFVLLCPIGEQFLLSSCREFVHVSSLSFTFSDMSSSVHGVVYRS